MVIAGLLIGNQGATPAMTPKPRAPRIVLGAAGRDFEAVLFLLIGVEIIAITLALPLFGLAVAVCLGNRGAVCCYRSSVALFRARIGPYRSYTHPVVGGTAGGHFSGVGIVPARL